MISILKNILTSNSYMESSVNLCLDNAAAFLFLPSIESTREEYFVILQLKLQNDNSALSILNELAEDIFSKILGSKEVLPSFEKNCTLLICHKESCINRETILKIEEDPYNFKKNVITYSEEEENLFTDYVNNRNIIELSKEAINNIVNENGGEYFTHFKNNQSTKNHYTFVLKLAIKIPFLTYQHQTQELSNLLNDIETSLFPDQLYAYNELFNIENDWNDQDILNNVEKIWGSK
ncbi:ABC-three component system middle component 1 [Shewanella algae]|uniref:ABC-three component system middle component 1 n=1 Tax=Shewanella algae TaxID=38313 RepID=UPI0005ED0EB1